MSREGVEVSAYILPSTMIGDPNHCFGAYHNAQGINSGEPQRLLGRSFLR